MELAVGTGVLVTAAVLGITHGIEPDHVAGITALTNEANDPWLSAVVGACFAAGHAILVVLWIAVAWGLFGMAAFPATFERLGLVVVGGVLGLLGLYLGITGTRRLVHRHVHDHEQGPHAHYHVHLPGRLHAAMDGAPEDHADHGHGVLEYLKIGTVGALFTLSPPVSMIAFVSVTIGATGPQAMVAVVGTYVVAIVATMAAVGGGVGQLFSRLQAEGQQVYAASQVVASLLVLGFAAAVLAESLPPLLG